MRYFEEALDGDEEFRLHPLDVFAGLNMVVLISSTIGERSWMFSALTTRGQSWSTSRLQRNSPRWTSSLKAP